MFPSCSYFLYKGTQSETSVKGQRRNKKKKEKRKKEGRGGGRRGTSSSSRMERRGLVEAHFISAGYPVVNEAGPASFSLDG